MIDLVCAAFVLEGEGRVQEGQPQAGTCGTGGLAEEWEVNKQ